MTDFSKLSYDMKKQYAEELLNNPAFVYMVSRNMKASLESFEGCKYEEVNKRDYLFAKYKTIKDFVRDIELLTKPKRIFTME